MSETKTNQTENAVPAEFRRPETFRVAPIPEYGCFDDYIRDAEELYDEKKEAFMAGDVRSAEFPKLSDEWELISKRLITGSAAFFGKYPQNAENKKRALEILDRCKKDAGIREKNLKLHYELAKQAGPEEHPDLGKLFRKVADSLQFFFRAENTHMAYVHRFLTGPYYVNPEYEAEKERGERALKKMQMVPEKHRFYPARPFSPVIIPEGERVPYPPAAFIGFKNLPPEVLVFDEEHDEFVLPKGFVSEDGLLDDQSVVWNWEERTVTCKLVGGEPVTWPFYKPMSSRDVLPQGAWPLEYNRRAYEQYLSDSEPPGANDP